MSIFTFDFMIRALLGALLVGLTAPAVGVYLVQRRMALLGDGIGHIALTGVALGFLFSWAPVLTAVLVSAAGAVVIELIRARGRTSGDVALAVMFYGGIAGGVLLIGLSAGTSNVNLLSYLFGSLLTTSWSDLVIIAVLAAAVLVVTLLLRPWLFAVCHDEEFATVSGLPVRLLNLVLAVTAAVTVTVAMRVVGLLLVSALMVIPVATAQQVARGFVTTMLGGIALGVTISLSGAVGSYYLNVASGAAIVVLAIAVFLLVTAGTALLRRRGGAAAARTATTPDLGLDDEHVMADG
ncbi:MAG TPA: metal ABC transporter permease [Mycobacteriales bacterium]|jgi:zinc transport system permease protein|nr:transporter [Cryptosporangiaceae bacterium]MDQ1677753.1 zinc transport system permease protein [Actinomycetota bacterium]HEV7754752.1 metal ABC transporter permease [Mycobacteriales bacterium]